MRAFAQLAALAACLLATTGAAAAAPAPAPAPMEISGDTTDPVFRAYYNAFSRRLVAGGEANYPKVNGKPIYGRVSVAVTVRETGEVEHIDIIQSGSRDLSRHAVNLVKALQPFPAFSREMRARNPRLVLVANLNYAKAPGRR